MKTIERAFNKQKINPIFILLQFILLALLITLINSCDKKECKPENENEAEENNYGFKYSKNIRVYDESKIYFMDITVSSNEESKLNTAAAELENSTVELITKNETSNQTPINYTTENLENLKVDESTNAEPDLEIRVNMIEKGEALGMKLKANKNTSTANKTETLYSTSIAIWIVLGPVNYYTVYSINQPINVKGFYSNTGNNGPWTYDTGGVFFPGQTYTSSGLGAISKAVSVQKIGFGAGFAFFDVQVY